MNITDIFQQAVKKEISVVLINTVTKHSIETNSNFKCPPYTDIYFSPPHLFKFFFVAVRLTSLNNIICCIFPFNSIYK